VDINWSEGKMTTATISARNGGDCMIRTNEPVVLKTLNLKSMPSAIGYTISFKAGKGKRYTLSTL